MEAAMSMPRVFSREQKNPTNDSTQSQRKRITEICLCLVNIFTESGTPVLVACVQAFSPLCSAKDYAYFRTFMYIYV